MTTTPAGWYDDGSGRQRWWDGQQWTEHFAPDAAAPADQTPAAASETHAIDDTVIRPSEESATAATTPLGDDFGAYAPPRRRPRTLPPSPRASPPVTPAPTRVLRPATRALRRSDRPDRPGLTLP
ncbi:MULTISPECIES: DUF2510 domain-containing protein [unclassified Microbacterium]|uniref:DUF2510 domain-containing protein n=1 Tax=unclassified Microbacterium TaxID=2609290 RepID=UPI001604BD2A|nr:MULTISPECIES: DUF2510 domain-containing protein [unclassified Microbacterium]QNA93053.1 DUF2510 domain-containing protein [Microbacterium sp. Se63.02b]QYM63230.1 DUF2510 domain-containing protein [Microbacterium sp. Se5.02b]